MFDQGSFELIKYLNINFQLGSDWGGTLRDSVLAGPLPSELSAVANGRRVSCTDNPLRPIRLAYCSILPLILYYLLRSTLLCIHLQLSH